MKELRLWSEMKWLVMSAANDEATDQHAGIFVSGSEQVSKSKIKKKKHLPIKLVDSDYNLDSLIAWCSSLKMLIRATAYLLRTVGRRFLRRGEIDVSEYCIQQGEIGRSEMMMKLLLVQKKTSPIIIGDASKMELPVIASTLRGRTPRSRSVLIMLSRRQRILWITYPG